MPWWLITLGFDHMNSLTLQIFSTFVAVLFLAIGYNLITSEWRRFQREKAAQPKFARMQLIRRLSGAILVVLLGVILHLGVNFPTTFTPTPKMFFRFWGTFSLYIFLLLIIAGWDMVVLRKELRRQAKKSIKHNLFGSKKEIDDSIE